MNPRTSLERPAVSKIEGAVVVVLMVVVGIAVHYLDSQNPTFGVSTTTPGASQGASSQSNEAFGSAGGNLTVRIPSGAASLDEVSYIPQAITVVIGVNSSVTWVNYDSAAHTVTAKDGSFGSGNMPAGGTFTYNFTTPGTYAYYCAYLSWMIGQVTVKSR